MSSVEAHYLLNSLYNLEFKLFDHMDAYKKVAEPFAVIRAFPQEDPQADSLLEDVVTRYCRNKIHQRFHMTLLDYLKLPCPTARKLDEIAESVVAPMEREESVRQQNAIQQTINNVGQK